MEEEIAPSVRPQKLPAANRTVARLGGTPFTSYPHRRASLMADSPASTPVFMGRTLSYPNRVVMYCSYEASASL